MDLNGSCPHLQCSLIEESDELSCEEDKHLLSQELCGVRERQLQKNMKSGNIQSKVSIGMLS